MCTHGSLFWRAGFLQNGECHARSVLRRYVASFILVHSPPESCFTPARRNVFLREDAMHHCGRMASSFPALGLTRLTGLAFGLCCSRLPLKLFLPFHQVVLHASTACRSCLPKTGKAVLGSPPKSVAAFLSKIVLSSDAPLPRPGVPCPLSLRTGSTPARFASPCQALRPGPAPASDIPSGDA